MTFLTRLSSLFRPQQNNPERISFSESENEFLVGAASLNTSDLDRTQYSREDILTQCLDAWRFNPLARRITEIISQYVVGAGFTVSSPNPQTETFLQDFWSHRFNRMDSRLIELCDELTRSGNLFILLSTDAGGMSYLRVIPASQIDEITTKENDIEQELSYILKPKAFSEPVTYPAFDIDTENLNPRTPDHASDSTPHPHAWTSSPHPHAWTTSPHGGAEAVGRLRKGAETVGPLRDHAGAIGLRPVVLHYSINKPAGAIWGESDLSPILKWLSRYSAFLDDRVRLNRYRNAFLYVVKAAYTSESTRKARQSQLALNPPTPGSILVTDESENWEVISPKLESDDAERDGLALKKMIASGVGIPLHFLAEPESSTRSTAEASGGPTYRKFQQRQTFFTYLIHDLLTVVIERHNLITGQNLSTDLKVHPGDLSGRDNVALAMAGSNLTNAFQTLYDLGAVSLEEMVRVLYRFIGEEGDPKEIVSQGTGIDIRSKTTSTPNPKQPAKIDPETGDLKGKDIQ